MAASDPSWAPHPPQADLGPTVIGGEAVTYIGPGGRLAARLIDGLLLLLLSFIPVIIVVGYWMYTTFSAMTAESAAKLAANPNASTYEMLGVGPTLAIVAISLSILLIDEVWLVVTKGGNLGKLVIGQRVVDASTGTMITPRQAMIRTLMLNWPSLIMIGPGLFLPEVANNLISIFALAYLVIMFMVLVLAPPRFRGFHDRVANTMVIRRPLNG